MNQKSINNGGPSLRVIPSIIEFKEIELNIMYITTFTIQNISLNALRYRLSLPQLKCFQIVHAPNRIIAPGMSVNVDVKFVAKNLATDHIDNLILTSPGTKIKIPLRAYVPSSLINFDGFIDLGPVVLNSNSGTYINMINNGVKDGHYEITYDDDLPLNIYPKSGVISHKDENNKEKVKIDFTGSKLGIFRCIANVKLDKQPDRIIDINATVVEHRLEFVLPDGGGKVSSIPFGSLYYGQERTIIALLVNNGPKPIAFVSNLIADRNLRNEENTDIDDMSDTEDLQHSKSHLKVTPFEGVIDPYAQTTFTFHYKPQKPIVPKGFAATSKFNTDPIALNTLLEIHSEEIQQKLSIPINGRAVFSLVEVSEKTFDFGKCQYGSRVDILMTIKNSGVLPASFHINKVAHFRCTPSKGKLEAMQSMTCIISFIPAQFGLFENTLNLIIGHGLQKLLISVKGEAEGMLTKEKSILKPKVNATPEDFKPNFQFTCNEEINQSKLIRSTFQRIPAWKKAIDEGMRILDAEAFANGNEARLTYCLPELQRREIHRMEYNNFLKESRIRREKLTETKMIQLSESIPINIGIIPQNGMEGPIPDLPKTTDKLWLKSDAVGKGSINGVKLDENRLIVKKFQPHPITQAERHDCSKELTADKINRITCGPKNINFGCVCINSTNRKSFGIINNLSQTIFVEIVISNVYEELSQSSPMSQVIPGGCTAGFDIIFFSATEQDFSQSFTYIINGKYTYKATVIAEVVPISVNLSKDIVEFNFPSNSYEETLVENLTISNPGNATAKFKCLFENKNSAFSVYPDGGSISPGKSTNVAITYEPRYGLAYNTNVILSIEGGIQSSFNCFAVNKEPKKFRFREKKIDFGIVAAGMDHTRSLHISNINGENPVVFYVDPLPPKYNIKINPLSGILDRNSEQVIDISIFSAEPLLMDNVPLKIRIREGKAINIPINAKLIFPKLQLLQSEISFGKVTIGVPSKKQISFRNEGCIAASLYLDLSKYSNFSISPIIDDDVDDEEEKDERIHFKPFRRKLSNKTKSQNRATGNNNCACWEIYCPPGLEGHFYLNFSPTQIEKHCFPLPLVFVGITSCEHIQPMVIADSVKPQLIISNTLINLDNCIIVGNGESKRPSCSKIKFTNNDLVNLSWEIDLERLYEVSPHYRNTLFIVPKNGELSPKESITIKVNFIASLEQTYDIVIPVYLDGNKSEEYSQIHIIARGIYPHIGFSVKDIVLPLVPLSMPSCAKFQLINYGYDNTEVKYRIPVDLSKVPLKVVFSKGSMLGLASPTLDVEIHFMPKRSVHFTTKIDFYDAEGRISSLPISGTAENCLLTNSDFILQNGNKFDYFTEPPFISEVLASPCYLLPLKQVEIYKNKIKQKSSIGPIEFGTCDSIVDISTENPTINKNSEAFLFKFIRKTFDISIQQLPDDGTNTNGKIIYTIIGNMGLKLPPDRLTKASKRKNERLCQLHAQYKSLLRYLKSYGGMFHGIKPEYFFSQDDYVYVRMSDTSCKQSKQSSILPQIDHIEKFEKEWEGFAHSSWTTLLYQIIKCFILYRIDKNSFEKSLNKFSTSMPDDLIPSNEMKKEKKGALKLENTNYYSASLDISKFEYSNIYSVSEHLLLAWINYHCKKIKVSKHIMNFSSDLIDGVAIYAILLSHIPSLGNPGEVLSDFNFNKQTESNLIHNISMIIRTLDQLNINFGLSVEEWRNMKELEVCLLCLHLYHALPNFLPKAIISFTGMLGTTIQKKIDLQNPTKKTMEYSILVEGSNEFIIRENSMVIEPQGSASLLIELRPRFTRQVEARLTLQEKSSSFVGGTMVFTLISTIESRRPIRTYQLESPIYENSSLEIDIQNQFKSTGVFLVNLVQDANSKSQSKMQQKPIPTSYKDFVENHNPFYCKVSKISMKANEKNKLLVHFLPLKLGSYCCQILFLDENIGEFMYEITGTSMFPLPLEQIRFKFELKPQISKEVILPFKNPSMMKAINVIIDRMNSMVKSKVRDALKKSCDSLKVKYRVEINSPYWSSSISDVTMDDIPQPKSGSNNVMQSPRIRDGQSILKNTIPLLFQPKAAGIYQSKIVLRSPLDMRVLDIESSVTSPGIRTSLEFSVPSRQKIIQDIPIQNHSDSEWTLRSVITGSKHFFGPATLRVPAQSTVNYPLTFRPSWMTEETALFVLSNLSNDDKYEYDLKGIGEEPIAEDQIKIECCARNIIKKSIQIPNIHPKHTTYTVESDISCITGLSEMTVDPGKSVNYDFTFMPLNSGKYEGSITFKSNSGEYLWYEVFGEVASPNEESTLNISSLVREAVSVEISLSNPLKETIVFDIELKGVGLIGDETFRLDASQSGTYKLIFSPLKSGTQSGGIIFSNEKVGEFWYKLNLVAETSKPIELELMSCAVGMRASQPLTLFNPTNKVIELSPKIDNERNYSIRDSVIVLEPYESINVILDYSPSSLTQIENGRISLMHPDLDDWIFLVKGIGSKPDRMTEIVATALLGQTSSELLMFKNPFSTELLIKVSLEPISPGKAIPDEFKLMIKKQKFEIDGFSSYPISISFSPVDISSYSCNVVIQGEGELKWIYPLRGVAEAPPVTTIRSISCKARDYCEEIIELDLQGFHLHKEPENVANFDYELDITTKLDKVIRRAVQITPICTRIEDSKTSLRYLIRFDPLRPFESKIDFIVKKTVTGGQWRFPIQLEATEPSPDDTINIESTINQTSSVSFKLCNQFRERTSFRCEFTLTSSPVFSVFPLSGELDAYGENGTNFIVSFTPLEYGQVLTARLLILTEEMQWTFDIRGSHPKYIKPRRASMVDNNLSSDVAERLSIIHKNRLSKQKSKRLPHNSKY